MRYKVMRQDGKEFVDVSLEPYTSKAETEEPLIAELVMYKSALTLSHVAGKGIQHKIIASAGNTWVDQGFYKPELVDISPKSFTFTNIHGTKFIVFKEVIKKIIMPREKGDYVQILYTDGTNMPILDKEKDVRWRCVSIMPDEEDDAKAI